MSGQRFTLWTIALVAVIAAIGYRMSTMRESPAEPHPKVAFIASGSGPYWQATINGAKAAARDKRVDLRVEVPKGNENVEEQIQILSVLDVKDLSGIALSPIDAERQTHLINQMVREGKKVVTLDSDAPLSDRHNYVGTNNIAAGETAARLVKEALPQGGKVAVLLANLTKNNMVDRKAGFEEVIAQAGAGDEAAPDYEVVGYQVDEGDSERCAQNIREALEAHPDLACFVGMTARSGPILLKELEEQGKLGQIKLVTFDDAPETLQGIEDGSIHATVAQDPYKYGYEAISMLASLCRNPEVGLPIVGKGFFFVSVEPIRQDNLAAFRDRLKARQKATESKGGGDKEAG